MLSRDDPREWTERLAACAHPYLIGVRHHSPVLAAAVPTLLDAFAPDVLLVELPPELSRWLEWLGHPDTVAPVALAAVGETGTLAFYPFADFSPELAAIRWAAGHGIEVIACDAPLSVRPTRSEAADPGESLVEAMRARLTGRAGDDLWDRLVEAPAPGAAPESVRRAALATGWAMRTDAGEVSAYDLAREAWMRVAAAATVGRRTAAVVGAFHAPALIEPGTEPAATTPASVVTSLVPYPFELLDSRSGYPAGIRDPRWQQGVYEAGADPAAVRRLAAAVAVRVTAALRADGHAAGPAEAAEATRLADDLAALRGLSAPGRGEVVEALQSVLAQGQVYGRGRAVAAAMQEVLVGRQYGRLPADAPRTGLIPAVLAELEELRLPRPGDDARAVRLDPLRSDLDRRREVALCRLAVCDVPYAERQEVAAIGAGDALTTAWWLRWQPATEAMLGVAGLRGVTLTQAAEGTLRLRRQAQRAAGDATAAETIAALRVAAECGYPTLVAELCADVESVVGASGTLDELLDAIVLVESLARGHVPGYPESTTDLAGLLEELDAAAVREVDGRAGSTRIEDARALLALAQRGRDTGRRLRLEAALNRLLTDGTPLMQGAAGAVLTVIGLRPVAEFAQTVSSFVDGGNDALRAWLAGTLVAAGTLLATGAEAIEALLGRVEEMDDASFVRRLPALRGGFDTVSPAGRDRLLAVLEERTAARVGDGDLDPEVLADWLSRDGTGRAELERWGLLSSGWIPAADRWRLVLGRRTGDLTEEARRQARALDELYGAGRGEGSRGIGAGRQAPFPNVRAWREELSAIFGEDVCTEVLAAAAERGRVDAALELRPDQVRPSIELLHTVLSLAGGLPEARLARLRPLVARLVRELTEALAVRLRPALTGITTPRPTRRRTGTLDLAATVRANLRTVRAGADGRPTIVPERPLFRRRAARSVDWRLIILVDVSGSMEASTVWAAMTASILTGVPALTTHFVTFSTDIVDLSERVDDPLALLLEVSVGGGTNIGLGLRYARSLVTNPTRTLVAVVSDFEEGISMSGLLGEVRALVESGCHLIGCASLDDQARPRYSVGVAELLVAAGMPVAALSPLALARWVKERVQ